MEQDDAGFYTIDIRYSDEDGDDNDITIYRDISLWLSGHYPDLQYRKDWTCSYYVTQGNYRFRELNVAKMFWLAWGHHRV